jgi:hypothetical protein
MEAVRSAVEMIRPVVAFKFVDHPIQFEPTPRNAIPIPPDQAAEVGMIAQVALQIVKSKHNVA